MTRLFFVSHRTGRPEIWCELRATGDLQQLTDQPDLGEWSVHPSHARAARDRFALVCSEINAE